MATLTTTMTFSNQTVADFTNWAKPFGNAFSTLGWVNSNDIGSVQSNASYGSATITNVQIQNNVLQITFSGASNQFSAGQAVLLTGLTTNTFLNNQIVRVTNALGSIQLLNFTVTNVASSVGGQAVYTVGGLNATANYYAGLTFSINGFNSGNNNGTFFCVASSSTTLTLLNAGASSQGATASATSQPYTPNGVYTLAAVASSVGATAVYSTPSTAITNANITSATAATLTVTSGTGFTNGQTIVISGCTGTNNAQLNGTWILTSGAGTTTLVIQGSNWTTGNNAETTGSIAVQIGTNAANNAFVNATFVVAGFTNGVNNGTFVCTASTNKTLTLYNSAATAETHAATATQQPDHTNTVFTALFTHADVASVSDTGTAAIVYNWNTVTQPPDPVVANNTNSGVFPIGQVHRFRGAFVAATPTFTNIQTTSNLTTLTFSSTGHGLDLTYAKGLGLIISQITNTNFTWLNSNPNGGWPIVSLTTTTVVINTGASSRPDIASTPVTVGIASPTYIGGSQFQNSAFGQSTCDVVTYNGDLYIATSSSYFQVVPGYGTFIVNTSPLVTNGGKVWARFAYDIWKSNDALTSTNPIFFKVIYGNDTGARPTPLFYWGCATDGVGNITTNYNWGGNQIVNPFDTNASATVGTTDTALWESNFSGTAGRFHAILWRGFPQVGGGPQIIINIERSHDNSGNDTDAYWTVIFSGEAANSTSQTYQVQQSIFKPGTGGAGPLFSSPGGVGANVNSTVLGCVNTSGFGLSVNNSIPAIPIFPLVGYVGNPMIGAICMKSQDTADGALVTASFYGTSHTYLMCTRGGAIAFGPGTSINVNASNAAGIRWE